MENMKFSISKECLKALKDMALYDYPKNSASDALATVTELLEFCRDGSSIGEGFVDELIEVARLIRSYKAIACGISSDINEYENECEITAISEVVPKVRLCTTIEEWFDETCTDPEDYLFDVREAMATLLKDDNAAQETKKKLGGVFQRIGFLIEGLQAILINNK